MPVKVELNMRGLNALMTSEPVQKRVDEAGEALAASAGEGFEYTRGKGASPRTARGYVQMVKGVRGFRAAARQRRDAVLERAIAEQTAGE